MLSGQSVNKREEAENNWSAKKHVETWAMIFFSVNWNSLAIWFKISSCIWFFDERRILRDIHIDMEKESVAVRPCIAKNHDTWHREIYEFYFEIEFELSSSEIVLYAVQDSIWKLTVVPEYKNFNTDLLSKY